jgi:hypothetical protein
VAADAPRGDATRHGWACRDCGSTNKTLNVHHAFYIRGLNPWEYDSDLLVTLCEGCHAKAHGKLEPIAYIVSRVVARIAVPDPTLCGRCQASFPVHADRLCDECHHIVNGTVSDWQDDPAPALQPRDAHA